MRNVQSKVLRKRFLLFLSKGIKYYTQVMIRYRYSTVTLDLVQLVSAHLLQQNPSQLLQSSNADQLSIFFTFFNLYFLCSVTIIVWRFLSLHSRKPWKIKIIYYKKKATTTTKTVGIKAISNFSSYHDLAIQLTANAKLS